MQVLLQSCRVKKSQDRIKTLFIVFEDIKTNFITYNLEPCCLDPGLPGANLNQFPGPPAQVTAPNNTISGYNNTISR